MSIEHEDRTAVEQSEGRDPKSSKVFKISYTREFLLSLSELVICKRLPNGFDESLLSEFDDTSHGLQDLPRIPGSSTLHGFRRNDYSSSPPGRGDMGNYSRGLHRWDSRSSGRSDTDSQSDKDSDSGRHFGSQYKRSWQNPEHDGLLGSGFFPKPSGHGAGASVPRFRANDQHQLSRSSDPYHPPRPYKAVPHTRKEDSYNDETFGSSEIRSEDRAEEERKRRAEFEMMRKVQQKTLQEKFKLNADKLKQDPLAEMIAMDNSGNAKTIDGSEERLMNPVVHSDLGKISSSSQATLLRPLVPPGFRNTSVERNHASGSLSHSEAMEVVKLELGAGSQDGKEATLPLASKGGMKVDLSSAFEMSGQVNDADTQSLKASKFSNSEVYERNSTSGIGSEHITEHTIEGEAGCSASILEKIFSGALSLNGGGDAHIIQDDDTKTDDVWSPEALRSSKFAQWFPEEEKKSKAEDVLPGKSSDLLSLIVGEKGESAVPDAKIDEQMQPFESNLGKMASNSTPKAVGTSKLLYNKNKPEAKSPILTCEDLEQSILSEIGETSLISQLGREGFSSQDVEKERPRAEVDNSASNHLLSLLLKGSSSESASSLMGKNSSNEPHDFKVAWIDEIHGNLSDGNAENLSSSERKLTLEALFGTAFMNELHSVDQPVSVQRNSVGSARIVAMESVELPFPTSDDGVLTSSTNEVRSRMMNCDDNISSFEGRNHPNVEQMERNWLNFGNSHHPEVDSVKLLNQIGSKLGGLDGLVDMQLPEEDSLISASDPLSNGNSMLRHELAGNAELSSSSKPPMSIVEKLAALSASVKDDRTIARRPEGSPPFYHSPYDMMKQEVPFSKFSTYSALQFNPSPHMIHGRPVFHPLDSLSVHMDPHLNSMGAEGIMHHHDSPPSSHYRIPGNMPHPPFQPLNPSLPDFDRPGHSMLHQQMHMPGNLPPPHMLQDFPCGGSLLPPHHPGGNPAGLIQEQGFPFGQRQPNLGGLGMQMPWPGPDIGGMNNQPPEAFQMLLERELRSNKNPTHGHELDADFWFR